MAKPIPEADFLLIVEQTSSLADAARKLGMSNQSVRARLDRIRLKGTRRRTMPRVELMDSDVLERYWHDAHENQEFALADHIFSEMCDRLDRKTRRK